MTVAMDEVITRYLAAFEGAHGPAKKKPSVTYSKGWFSVDGFKYRRVEIDNMIGRLQNMPNAGGEP